MMRSEYFVSSMAVRRVFCLWWWLFDAKCTYPGPWPYYVYDGYCDDLHLCCKSYRPSFPTPPLRGVSDHNTTAAVYTAETGLQLLHTLASCRMNSDDLWVAMLAISDICAATSSASFCSWEIPFSGRETSVHAQLRCLTNCRSVQLVLHVFEEDTVANVTVSHGKSFCGCFCLGPAPFLVCFAVFGLAAKRKSGWGICGSFWFRWFLFVLSLLICHFRGPYVSLYKTAFPCLRYCKDRALVRHRPNRKEKKGPFLAPSLWQICWGVYFKWKLIWAATAAAGILNWGGPFLRACFFLCFEVQKRAPSLSYYFARISIALRSSRPASKSALLCFVPISMSCDTGVQDLHWGLPPTLFHPIFFLVCCKFQNLEVWRLALRPSLCASCGLKF